MANTKLYVRGLSKETTESELVIYFQSKKKSGGGDIETIDLESDRAVITFGEEGVLERVLSKGKHTVKGFQLEVSGQSFVSQEPQPKTVQHKDTGSDLSCNKIEIKGLSPKTTKDSVANYFENSRRSGGGDVEEVIISDTTAHVTFASSEVAQNVLSREHKLDGVKLFLALHKPEKKTTDEEKEGFPSSEVSASRVVEVSGLSPQTTEDAVCNYFENTRRSGGGDIEHMDLQRESGVAVVTFVLLEDAQRVVEKGQNTPHRLDGNELTVTIKEPVKQLPKDPLKLLVRGLSDKTTPDGLSCYMEAISGEEVCNVTLGDSDNALVFFSEKPDFNKVMEKTKKKLLDGNKLTVEQVEVCNCVMVMGLPPNVTEDTITLYFESKKRSNGGEVSKIEFTPGQSFAFVYFDDSEVIDRVVSREHCLNNVQVAVKHHYPFFVDASEKGQKALPKSHEVEYVQPVLQFIEDQYGDELDQLLKTKILQIERVPDTERLIFKSGEENQMDESEWEKACNEVLSFLSMFGTKSVRVTDEALVSFEERADETVQQFTSKELIVMPLTPEHQMSIVGIKNKVDKLAQQLEDLVIDIVEEERFKASVVTDEMKDIPVPKLLLLLRSGLQQRLQDEHKGLIAEISPEKNAVFFKGPQGMINKATLIVWQILAKSKEEPVELPTLIVSLLKTEDAQEHIYNNFEKNDVVAVLSFENNKANEVTAVGVNGTQARQAAKLVKDLTKERSTHLDEDQAQLMKSTKWGSLRDKLQRSSLCKVEFDSTTSTLWIGGCCNDVEESANEIEKFLEENTIVTEIIPLSTGQRKFLFKYWESKVKAVQRNNHFQSVSIKKTEDEEGGVIISGTVDGVQGGVREISDMVRGILCRNIPIDRPGMRKYFIEAQGATVLKVVENEHKCIVEIKSASKPKSSMSSIPEEAILDSFEKCLCTYATPEAKKISLYKGDITKHRVDVIVNAANASLEHIGGVAKAIVDAGGREIQEECRRHINQNDVMLVGDVFVSGAYKLPCKKVVHTVGPRWTRKSDHGSLTRDKKTKEERYLSLAIYNSLEESESYSSIAFPAISTGVFGFPPELCAEVMIDTILEFSENNQGCAMKDIHIIDRDNLTVSVFAGEMRKRFGKEADFWDSATAIPKASKKSKTKLKGKPKSKHSTQSVASVAIPVSPSDPYTIVTPQNVLITLREGDLSQEEADVLVNTTAADMNLSSNPCAKALSERAGPALQQECTSKAPLNSGDLCVTTGGKLKCTHVFHVNCGDQQSLRVLLQKCLKEAHTRKLKSIAIPAIGTGNLGFPRDQVARLSIDEASSFIQKSPSTSLKEIRWVVFDRDTATVQAFQSEFKSRNPSVVSSFNVVKGDSVVSPVNAKKGKRRRSRGGGASSTAPIDVDDDEEEPIAGLTPFPVVETRRRLEDSQFELQIGPLTVQVQVGDVTSENVDAIVTVSNVDLDVAQGGGVGAAIARVGGRSIQDECSSLGRQTRGSVVATGAGKLRAKSVYHIVPTSQDPPGIKDSVVRCLRAADSNGISSISFPAIGTGNLGLQPKNSAKAMLAAIDKFSQGQFMAISLIRVVVFQAPMLQDFRDALEEFVKETPSSGFLSSVSGFIKGMGRSILGLPSDDPVKRSLSIQDKVSLEIFAGSENNLSDAIRAIDDTMARNCTKQVICHESIEKLTEKRRRQITRLERIHDVKISVEPRVSRIVVQGHTSDLLDVSGKIYDILTKGVEEEHARGYAELLVQSIQWCYADEGEMTPYDKEVNAQIEQAYGDKETSVIFTMEGQKYEIVFKNNEERNLNSGEVTEVCRKEIGKGGIELPDKWEPQPTDSTGKEKDVHLVQLDPVKNSTEYNNVSSAVLKTASVNIAKIERVQNPTLYQTYFVRKQAMDKKSGSNEMFLFHGTAGNSVATINRSGFNRSYCGKHAVAYGKGVYFARDASYSTSSTYSPPDPQGNRYIYLASVLVGQYTTGNQNMITPPPKSSSDPTDTYDSVANRTGAGASIFVVFYDNQCYPDYLITFK